MIVLDASAAVDVLLERGARGDWVARRLLRADSVHAPHLIDIEVASVVRRRVSRRAISARRGREALQELAAFPMTRYPATPLLERIWELRSNSTAYDANYVALAEALEAPLVTMDARLASTPGHRARVDVFRAEP